MDATPISFETALPLGGVLVIGHEDDAAARKWAALHEAAFVVATLAGITHPVATPAVSAFPAALGEAPGWRRELAAQAVDDLVAIMEPGLAALIAVHTGGGDAAAPALALWQEFAAARDALVAMIAPED